MVSGQQIINGCAQKQEALAELTRGARPRSYGRGELLSDIEERDGFVYLLNTGRVGLYSLSRQGLVASAPHRRGLRVLALERLASM